ncbi:DUF427 domain-containing protein [bacterium]|nr:DUF427 domain-containing protein [bacterium]
MKAIWKGKVLAESRDTIGVEGNHYFPPDSLNREYFRKNDYHTECPWKGNASYYDVVVDDRVNENTAWYYPNPKKVAEYITNYVAFDKDVEIKE